MDINYINELLAEGKTVKEVRAKLGLGEKAFQKQIKELGFKYNQKLKKYEYDKELTKDIQEPQQASSNDLILKYDNDVLKGIQDNLIDLSNDYDKIKVMLNWFENKEYDKEHIEVIQLDEGLKIDLPESEIVRTTVRANKEILDKFNSFCDGYKQYSKQDLLSQAMKEFIEKYNC